ncbi:endonuclease-8 [Crossiella equi]|uniref:DNA-(apurinic or apyrimidinic site) lyase n=1 Tax=Crossiella equi TaxID=130796 RepID=A0ABS5AKW6_9PSEU|nr:DNA-formamidopyrimidine glycosylase family protein [Crossiella equi]MBP2477211.1 endonuclease-8 [Crossiella equi]
MPEGDTVYLAARRLDAALRGQVLTRAELRHPALVESDLTGQTVDSVRSVGKHLLFGISGAYTLHTHFRMDGSWHLYRPGERWRGGPAHQVRAVLATAERVAVGYRLHDLALVRRDEEHTLVGHLGPDLLAEDWDTAAEDEAVRRLAADPARELGTALLDQRVLAGVGNIYKTEACFLLGVTPWTPVGEVDARAVVRLCRRLLWRNRMHPERTTTGHEGERKNWVYERGRRGCLRCGGRVRVGEQDSHGLPRVAYWCPTCQSGPAQQATGRVTLERRDDSEAEGGSP